MSNFCERIAHAAARFPGRPAIEMAGRGGLVTTTYAELLASSGRVAAWLLEAGRVRSGDRVAILAANDAAWIAAYLGTLRIGAVAVPLDTAYAPHQVATIVRDAGARVLFVSDRLHDVAHEAATLAGASICVAPLTALDEAAFRRAEPSGSAEAGGREGPPLHRDPATLPIVAMDDADAAAILYTSGTTADPKGVVLTHGNLEAERVAALGVIHVTEDDAVLGVLPLFHALAQMANLLLPLSAGARVVFLESINSASLVEALDARGITVFACVPQFFYLIHQRVVGEFARRGRAVRALFTAIVRTNAVLRDTIGANPGRRIFGRVHTALGSKMRMLITGGSRFDPAIARDLYGLGLTLLNGYGLTETSGAATVMRPGDRFTTSVGQPLPGVEVRIAPEPALADDGAAGKATGEILIRGPIVMREYFNRADATAEAIRDGWLHTGDLGRVDAKGRVYITGRKKEVIVLSSGKNLYPEEIEAHYLRSAFVKEICVLGVTDETAPAAERLHAIVVPDESALRARGTVNVRELIRFELEEQSVSLPPHKRVLGFDLSFEPLPRTTTGKLKRAEIARQHRAQAQAAAEPTRTPTSDETRWLDEDGHRRVVETIAARIGKTVLPDDNLELDLQLDSLERVELLAILERREGAQVSPEVRATIFTARQLAEAVLAAAGTGGAAADAPATDRLSSEWQTMLAAEPDAAIARDLSRSSWLRAIVLFVVLRAIVLIARAGVRLRVDGRAQFPASGPCILTPNHASYLDGFVVAANLPFRLFRRIFFVGAAEYFQTPLMKAVARLANIVPVDPDAHLLAAMRAAATGLRLGKVLMLFPEGERSIDGAIRPFRKGAAILSSHLGAPIVPVALDGLYALWPRGRAFRWRRLTPWHRAQMHLTVCAPMQVSVGDEERATTALQETIAQTYGRT
jgi:long-chain acyl-CoA synthetase